MNGFFFSRRVRFKSGRPPINICATAGVTLTRVLTESRRGGVRHYYTKSVGLTNGNVYISPRIHLSIQSIRFASRQFAITRIGFFFSTKSTGWLNILLFFTRQCCEIVSTDRSDCVWKKKKQETKKKCQITFDNCFDPKVLDSERSSIGFTMCVCVFFFIQKFYEKECSLVFTVICSGNKLHSVGTLGRGQFSIFSNAHEKKKLETTEELRKNAIESIIIDYISA